MLIVMVLLVVVLMFIMLLVLVLLVVVLMIIMLLVMVLLVVVLMTIMLLVTVLLVVVLMIKSAAGDGSACCGAVVNYSAVQKFLELDGKLQMKIG